MYEKNTLLALSFAALALVLTPGRSVAQSQSAYTAEQALRGRRVFGAYCATCHGVDLEGAVGPALAGAKFLHGWSARGAGQLYRVLRTSMPKPAVGSLSPQAYADVFAYLLSRNGLAAGGVAFDGSDSMLARIPLDSLATAAGPAPEAPPQFIAGKRMRPEGSGPDQVQLSTTPDPADWLYHTGNYRGTRYSTLSQITTANVGRLAPVCAYQLGVLESFYDGPIIYRGTMFLSTPTVTAAIDAATCRERWRQVWEPKDKMLWSINRGVAVKDGYVVRGTADGYLLALDAADGTLLWARQVAHPDSGETITMPPLIVDSLVVIGPAGSENNVQGWIGAFRLADGSPVWRFHTMPRPGEPGRETWGTSDTPRGGGAVWTPLSLDVARGQLFVAVTNPAPDVPAHLRPGANLYTNSVVALDVHTGKLLWYDQLVPADYHDWDVTQVSPLIRAKVGGVERDLLITANKDGLLRALDRRTHERLYQTAVTTRRNVEAPVTHEGTVSCPGPLGGVEWNGPAYNPGTGLLYVPAVDWCFKFTMAPDDSVRYVPGQLYLGGTAEPAGDQRGWLTAIDASNGKVRWRYHSPLAMVAAVTTTAGGLVFTGERTGDFLAFDAASGKELYRFNTGAGILGGVATYAVNGKQYVATTSGGGSFNFGGGGAATLFVFGLPDSRQ